MAGVAQNPGPTGALTMNDPLFKNWLKGSYAFKHLKSGLESFVSIEIGQRYRTLKQQVFQKCQFVQKCSDCTSDNLLPDHGPNGCKKHNCFCSRHHRSRRRCPNNFCSVFYDLIVDDHIGNTPLWSSTDLSVWYYNAFQYAKCFLGTHSPAKSFNDIDCTGILSVVINNCHIHKSINDVNLFKKCREDRNTIFHTGNYALTDQDLSEYIDHMINALEDRKTLTNNKAAKTSVANLNALRNGQLVISDVDIVRLVQDSLAAINYLSDDVKQSIEDNRKQLQALNDFNKLYADAISHIKTQKEYAVGGMDKHKDDAVRQLSEQRDKDIDKIDQHKDNAVRQLSEQRDKDIDKIDQYKENAVRQLSEQRDKDIDKIDQYKENAVRQLSEQRDKDIDKIDQHKENAVRQLSEQRDKDIDKIDQHKENAVRQLSEQRNNDIDKIDQHKDDAARQLSEQRDKDIDKIEQHKDNAVRLISQKGDEVIHYVQRTLANAGMSNEDIRKCLMKVYNEECCKLPVSPLCDEDENEMELLSIYKTPSLYHEPYHRAREDDEKYPLTSYQDIFCKDGRCFRKIYISGEAGVGKTSFCKRLSLLWCMSKSGGECVSDKSVQDDIEFISKFDFVFNVSLGQTHSKDIVTMIVEQLFCYENEFRKFAIYESVENILRTNKCIILMDAFDEWTPRESGKININRLSSDECTFVTTCRPYKIESERLSVSDIDRHVQMTGINEISTKHYVREIVNCINKVNRENKDPADFRRDVKKCGFDTQIRVPIIASHLIAVWFDHKLTGMSSALIYSNIVDMLLKRAEKAKHIDLPFVGENLAQFPGTLSELFYLNKHIALLKKLSFLSFNIVFNQDTCLSDLVFTTEGLESKPYCLSVKEMDFLCKFGLLSKQKVIGRFGKREHKLSFLHKSYLEYFAAMFVCVFDTTHAFNNVVQTWTVVDDVVKFGTLFRFISGFSSDTSKDAFDKIHYALSNELSLCRRNSIFHIDQESYSGKSMALQTMVISCLKEVSQTNNPSMSFKLEDFIFEFDVCNTCDDTGAAYDDGSMYNDSYFQLLKQLVMLNHTCVRSICSVNGIYVDVFDHVRGLQYLLVNEVLPGDYDRFTNCMLRNQSTLCTVCVKGGAVDKPLTPELPVKCLQHLTSLSLINVTMGHGSLHNLVNFLSSNVLLENIKLVSVSCDDHDDDDDDCTLALNLSNHTKLCSLCLFEVNILCNCVRNSELKSLTLCPLTERIVTSYVDVFDSIKGSQLEYLDIKGCIVPDYHINSLPYIKSLTLSNTKLVGYDALHMHSDVTQVDIVLRDVKMTRQSFQSFLESAVHNHSLIKVKLGFCNITSVDGDREMSVKESNNYMTQYLSLMSKVKITYQTDWWIHFETTNC